MHLSSRRRKSVVVSVLTALAIGFGIPGMATSAPDDHGASLDHFYDTSSLVPGPPGAVLRSQPLVAAGGAGAGQRLIYSTTDVHGAPVPVSGTVLEPRVGWGGPGPQPLAVIGPGTQGQGDQCAPSRIFDTGFQHTGTSTPINYEGIFASTFLAQGFRVFVTDYVGLGTPGTHTYVNRAESGHAILDGARAAATPDQPVVLWGHSQGGAAVASAAELGPEYAPELNLVAGYASSPPADLLAVQEHIDGTGLVAAIGYTINGFLARYPELREPLGSRLNDHGHAVLADVATQCLLDSRGKYGGHSTSEWTTDGRRLDEVIRDVPVARTVADEQRIGRRVPAIPVMVTGARHDDFIPYGQAVGLVRDWCAQGGTAVLNTNELPAVNQGSGNNHLAPSAVDYPVGLSFIRDRLAGIPVRGACTV
ncbi:alpha/beta fold hydrolase [Williamsia sp. 1138]|uniref:alpha/beta fold hydrolase n=1 Tax=Williamsia sp. 1138 TaxID=1903117 RepID=UPI001FEF8E09|nr:alpha/beta fold hydrolase [Williamsia sp. 1138]